MPDPFDRRVLLKLGCTAAVAAALPGCAKPASKQAPPEPEMAVDTSIVRVASVPTAVEGNLLPT